MRIKANKLNTAWIFVVRGDKHFPVDMLRYDKCFPHGQNDVINAFCDKEERSVELLSYQGEPTKERWKSFGWEVIKCEARRLG